MTEDGGQHFDKLRTGFLFSIGVRDPDESGFRFAQQWTEAGGEEDRFKGTEAQSGGTLTTLRSSFAILLRQGYEETSYGGQRTYDSGRMTEDR
jgi:hypothetical protein